MLESKVQSGIIKHLTGLGYLVNKVESVSGGGWPDLYATRTVSDEFFVETKRPGKDAEPLQKFRHKQLRDKGRTVYVFDTVEICKQTIKE